MKRIVLTDGSGRWFDAEKATYYDEDMKWNGNNNISCATGSQWDHEGLFYTAGGRWIRYAWSQWQGTTSRYEEITAAEAARWLSINHCDPPPVVATEYAALEIA